MRLLDPCPGLYYERARVPWPGTGDLEWVPFLKHSDIIGTATLSEEYKREFHALFKVIETFCAWLYGRSRPPQTGHTVLVRRGATVMTNQLVLSKFLPSASLMKRARSTADTGILSSRGLARLSRFRRY